MAGKGRQSWEKRQREKSKRDKQTAKRAERAEREEDRKTQDADETPAGGPTEAELYEQFAKLSEKHSAGDIDDETFEEKRAELFELLGLEIH